MNFLTNSNISLLLCSYYPVFLHCTIIIKFSVHIYYPPFFYFIDF